MDSILKKGVDFCFAPGIIQDVALNILQGNGNKSVISLKILSLKSIMTRKMKKDIYANVIFCLIFKVPKKHKIYREMTKDAYLMKAVLEQNMPDKLSYMKIEIDKELTKVDIYWLNVVEVKNEKEYDTYWAEVFTRLALYKFVSYVELSFVADEHSDLIVLKEKMSDWMDSIKPIIPEEGWTKALENGQIVYGKHPIKTQDNRVIVTFFTPWPGTFLDEKLYWGYLKE